MCDCGCEEPETPFYRSVLRSIPQPQERSRATERETRPYWDNHFDARRNLTYGDEDDDEPVKSGCCSSKNTDDSGFSQRSELDSFDFTGTPGVAIVRRPASNCPPQQTYQASPTPRGKTSCCQDKQPPPQTGGCPSKQRSTPQKCPAAPAARGKTPCCQDKRPSPRMGGCPPKQRPATQKCPGAFPPRTPCCKDKQPQVPECPSLPDSPPKKYRAALPPRGRTPCCQDDEPGPQIRGCPSSSRY